MRYHLVDAFVDERFAGNPAAVVLEEQLPDDALMQAAATHIGVPTTAFVARVAPGEYRVRWFTPFKEVNLCGHATIAAARHLFSRAEDEMRDRLTFVSDNGVLVAERCQDLVAIDLPVAPTSVWEAPPGLLEALGVDAVACAVSSDDVLVELADARAVAAVRPDFVALARQPFRGHVVTARADVEADGAAAGATDFVSRTFFPALGVNEDQVCVSAHAKLAPYWAERLGRTRLRALQLSQRGGRLEVELLGARVRVLGSAVLRGDGTVPAVVPAVVPATTASP